VPLVTQIVRQIRAAVIDGRLAAGQELPSSRELAYDLGVARNTTSAAYDALAADGTLVVTPRRRPTVAAVTPRRRALPAAPPQSAPVRMARAAARLAAVVPDARLDALLAEARADHPFRVGHPDLELVPWRALERALVRRARRITGSEALDLDPRGSRVLRDAIAVHVLRARGIHADAGRIFVTEGSQAAVDMCCRLLVDPGTRVWVEDPGPLALRAAIAAAAGELVPLPVDAEGVRVDLGIRRAPRARVAFVSPTSAFPGGGPLALPRRLALLRWAERARAAVVEVDVEGELAFDGSVLPSLLSLAGADDRVIHVGTFSRLLFPSLRLGFLVVPDALVRAAARLRASTTRAPPVLLQGAVADLLASGQLARHRRRLVRATRRRRELVARELAAVLPAGAHVLPAMSGAVLTISLPAHVDDVALARELGSARVRGEAAAVLPLSSLTTGPARARGLVLGVGAHGDERLAAAARRVARAIRSALR